MVGYVKYFSDGKIAKIYSSVDGRILRIYEKNRYGNWELIKESPESKTKKPMRSIKKKLKLLKKTGYRLNFPVNKNAVKLSRALDRNIDKGMKKIKDFDNSWNVGGINFGS